MTLGWMHAVDNRLTVARFALSPEPKRKSCMRCADGEEMRTGRKNDFLKVFGLESEYGLSD